MTARLAVLTVFFTHCRNKEQLYFSTFFKAIMPFGACSVSSRSTSVFDPRWFNWALASLCHQGFWSCPGIHRAWPMTTGNPLKIWCRPCWTQRTDTASRWEATWIQKKPQNLCYLSYFIVLNPHNFNCWLHQWEKIYSCNYLQLNVVFRKWKLAKRSHLEVLH